MDFPLLDAAVEKYAKYVITQAKSNLTKGGKGGGPLYESLAFNLKKEAPEYLLGFLMEDYGPFVDEGVKGANPGLIKNGYQKAPLSKFAYTNKMPPMEVLAEWAKKKNIRFRNAKGQYAKGSNQSMGFVLQRSIFAQGMKPTEFITRPLTAGLFDLENNMLDALAQDIENDLTKGNK
jgi:hypothetical protein|tara:strand:- start:140 stop:670 length:531 start_codon:yes stop_codon:yes gene_type:complete